MFKKNLKFIPNSKSIKSERSTYFALRKELLECNYVQSVVAYHTFYKDASLWRKKWQHPKGFHVVDLHLPTKAKLLCRHAKNGANLFLFTKSLAKEEGTIKENALMHPKIYLFDKGATTSIYIGSANYTNYALRGINIEAGVLIELETENPFVIQIKAQLEFYRSLSTKVNPDDLQYYLLLQNSSEKSIKVIYLICNSEIDLSSKEVCLYFDSSNNFDLTDFKVGDKIFVQVFDPQNSSYSIYRDGEIKSLTATNSQSIERTRGLYGIVNSDNITNIVTKSVSRVLKEDTRNCDQMLLLNVGRKDNQILGFRNPITKKDSWENIGIEENEQSWLSADGDTFIKNSNQLIKTPKTTKFVQEVKTKESILMDKKTEKVKSKAIGTSPYLHKIVENGMVVFKDTKKNSKKTKTLGDLFQIHLSDLKRHLELKRNL